METVPSSPTWVRESLLQGQVIPAHPLALTSARRFDERRQRALTRYYHAAGVGGIAVGVHTTQFSIREPQHGLLAPALQLAAETVAACDTKTGRQTVRIAGLCGRTSQALSEASLARGSGYHAGLLSLAAWPEESDDALLLHCKTVASELPLFGFYLQTAVGGRRLSRSFWSRFAEIPNVVGIKVAPFNRYQTLEVIRGVVAAGRAEEIALYTGNDDQILLDLLTEFVIPPGPTRVRFAGGLLGQWACWTRRAVEMWEECRRVRTSPELPTSWLTLAAQLTDANAALFDADHGFAGCLPGIHEVLRRQGILAGRWCLNPAEELSPGQAEEIDRVCQAYPQLNDDAFVREHLDDWLR